MRSLHSEECGAGTSNATLLRGGSCRAGSRCVFYSATVWAACSPEDAERTEQNRQSSPVCADHLFEGPALQLLPVRAGLRVVDLLLTIVVWMAATGFHVGHTRATARRPLLQKDSAQPVVFTCRFYFLSEVRRWRRVIGPRRKTDSSNRRF